MEPNILYRKPIILAIERAGEREDMTPTQTVTYWNYREVLTDKGGRGKFVLYTEKKNPDAVRLFGLLASGFNINDDIEHEFLRSDLEMVMVALRQGNQAPDFLLKHELSQLVSEFNIQHRPENAKNPFFKRRLCLLLVKSMEQKGRAEMVDRFFEQLNLDYCIGGGSLILDAAENTLWAHGYAFGLGCTPTRVVEGALRQWFQTPPFTGYEFLTAAKEIEDSRENPARDWYLSHGFF